MLFDSMAFMNSSLGALVETNKYKNNENDKMVTLENWDNNFNHTYKGFDSVNLLQDDHMKALDYLTKDGIYPYKWANSFDKFEHTELHQRECFWNDIIEEECSKDFQLAVTVWNYCK